MSWPHFLAPYDLPLVDHPVPQGIPLAAPPIQQVPLGVAVAEERVASSPSLEEEIDKFQFEEEEIQGVETILYRRPMKKQIDIRVSRPLLL